MTDEERLNYRQEQDVLHVLGSVSFGLNNVASRFLGYFLKRSRTKLGTNCDGHVTGKLRKGFYQVPNGHGGSLA